MAKCFYKEFIGAFAIRDGDAVAFAVDNFERLIRDGVMANARLLPADESRPVLIALKADLTSYTAGARALPVEAAEGMRESVERLIAAAQSAQEDAERILGG